MWKLFAFLSAICAALTSIFAKYGMKDINSTLATGASWLCYFKAVQMGEVSKVAPIDKLSIVFTLILSALILHERLTLKTMLGGVLITAGTLLFL